MTYRPGYRESLKRKDEQVRGIVDELNRKVEEKEAE